MKFDPMLSKLICFGESRDAAIDRLQRALTDYTILGTKTNLGFLRRVISHPAFREGKVSTRFLSDHADDLKHEMPEVVPMIAAALQNGRQATGNRQPATIWESLGKWGR